MIENITTAAEFLDWQETLGPWEQWTAEQSTARKVIFKSLSHNEKFLVQRDRIEKFFVEENRSKDEKHSKESVSPSGRYKLRVETYGTRPGAWSYTRGVVTRVLDGQVVADVKRNYSTFWFLWLEGHKNGHDYLICGEDYQGSTFCELDTGRMRTELPDSAFDGHGWCWTDADLMPDGVTLRAGGCVWACPYEYRFFDVSEPMNGWDEIELPDGVGSLDYEANSRVDVEGDTITWTDGDRVFLETGERERVVDDKLFNVIWTAKRKAEREGDTDAVEALVRAEEEHHLKYPDEDEDKAKWGRVVDHRIVLRRDGPKFVLVEEWKSDALLEAERRRKEYDEKSCADRARWAREDLLLAAVAAHIGGEKPLEGLVGFMYPSVMMRESGDVNPAYFRLAGRSYDKTTEHNHWVEIEYGVVAGDVKLENHVRGKGKVSTVTFPRTNEGIVSAWDAGQAHLAAEGGV